MKAVFIFLLFSFSTPLITNKINEQKTVGIRAVIGEDGAWENGWWESGVWENGAWENGWWISGDNKPIRFENFRSLWKYPPDTSTPAEAGISSNYRKT